jgi:O-antigen/teichoic acid export membrane protein
MRVAAVVNQPPTLLRAYLTSAGKQAAWNLSALVVLTGLTQVAALGTVLLLTNGLGPVGFGVFAFALSLQPYLYLIGTLGMPLILFREGTNEPEQLARTITVHQVVALTGGVIVGGLTACAAWLAPISGAEQGLICLIAGGNVAVCLTLAPLFDVHHRHPLVAVVGLSAEAGTLLAVFALVQTENLGLLSLGAVFAVKWWLTTAVQYVVYHLAIHPLRLVFAPTRLRRMLRSSVPLACSTLSASVPATAGIFFVRLFCGESAAGVFGVATQVASVYLLFSYLAIRILQPHIAGPYGLERSFVRKLILFTGVFLAILYAGGLAAGGGVALFVLTPRYREAVAPMALLLAAALVLSVGVIASSYLVVLHREQTVLAAHTVAGVVYVVLAVLLIPSFSNLGAATAAALAAACGTVWMVVAVRINLPPQSDSATVA